jgi:ribosomal protein S18 acetylase RimI-like enzyme
MIILLLPASHTVSEFLEYPDFSVCALYKRLLIGCAFITTDGYITYVAVHPDWREAGVASFMLFHLVHMVPDRDITLHVSATNNAMLLYQRFGFKAEEFVTNFYDRYLPKQSTLCRHAFYMRLRQ